MQSQLNYFTDLAKDAFFAITGCLCQQQARVKINGRTFNIMKVLGEGGFSLVYLVVDADSGRQFALKKISCPLGSESVREALREVEAYRRFRHPNIIRILDSAVVQDKDGEGKVVYLFLPIYKRGNLQDAINANLVNGTQFPEAEMIRLFKGTCEAIRAMHEYRAGRSSHTVTANQAVNGTATHNVGDDDDDSRLPVPEGDADGGGYSYDSTNRAGRRSVVSGSGEVLDGEDEEGVPLMPRSKSPARHATSSLESASRNEAASGADGDPLPYAHRDIKPGNVMISDDGRPILMDFGSCIKARVWIGTRSEALLQQDLAAQQSTMAYRAPELFDVKTETMIDESVDIWSLGCTLFALAYSHSPFESRETVTQGGSISMAVQSGSYKHPRGSESLYTQGTFHFVTYFPLN